MTEDLGWAPVPSVSLPWNDINQLILFNLATENGPGLDNSNIADINVPTWVATVHAHPGIKAIIAIGGAGNDNWGPACNNTNRAQFVQNLVGFATSNGFDGIDLDIEDGPWMRAGPPNPAMTTCIVAISTAAHSAGLFCLGGRDHELAGAWYAPSQSYVDQFNLMTYGDNLATVQRDVADTISQGLPASKFAVGVDVDEHPQPPGGCGQFSKYAAQAGLAGAFVWEAAADHRTGISARTVSPQAEAVARARDTVRSAAEGSRQAGRPAARDRRRNPQSGAGFGSIRATGAAGLEPATPGFGDRCSTN